MNATQQAEAIALIEDDPFLTAKYLGRRFNVSYMTIIRLLKNQGLHCRVAATQTRLTDEHKINRLAFCETLLENWSEAKLKTIIFSDEKTFSTDVRWKKAVYRPRNTRHDSRYIKILNLSGRINAAYWGAISIDGPLTDIVKIDGRFNSAQYLDILQNHILPVSNGSEARIFMQDNSPVHTARIIMDFLGQQRFETMQWPPLSPDLNPIENVWSYITFDWPEMNDRSNAALDGIVHQKWQELGAKKGIFVCEKNILSFEN